MRIEHGVALIGSIGRCARAGNRIVGVDQSVHVRSQRAQVEDCVGRYVDQHAPVQAAALVRQPEDKFGDEIPGLFDGR